jgi:hypothetical protein
MGIVGASDKGETNNYEDECIVTAAAAASFIATVEMKEASKHVPCRIVRLMMMPAFRLHTIGSN